MSIAGLMAGTQVEVVGVEDDPSGDLRVYLTHRSRGVYVRIVDPDAQRRVREAWAGQSRVVIPRPPAWAVLSDSSEPESAVPVAGARRAKADNPNMLGHTVPLPKGTGPGLGPAGGTP